MDDTEIRAGFDRMDTAFSRMDTAFGSVDRWFELMQAQHVEHVTALRTDMEQGFAEVARETAAMSTRTDVRFAGLENRLSRIESEIRQFRDWTSAGFAEVRSSVAQLTRRFETPGS